MNGQQLEVSMQVFRAVMAAELMIGFWFSIGVILAVGVVEVLNYCNGALMSGSSK